MFISDISNISVFEKNILYPTFFGKNTSKSGELFFVNEIFIFFTTAEYFVLFFLPKRKQVKKEISEMKTNYSFFGSNLNTLKNFFATFICDLASEFFSCFLMGI
jgi:hypothetical protein